MPGCRSSSSDVPAARSSVRDGVQGLLPHQQGDDRHAEDCETEADDEHGVEVAGQQREQREGEQRPDHRAGSVECPVNSERVTQSAGRRRSCDESVPRSRSDPLAGSVDGHCGAEGRQGPDGEQREFRRRRQDIARGRYCLGTTGSVGDVTAGEPGRGTDALVQPVDDAECQRRQPQANGDEQRQDRGHHLRGDVGEHARDAEQHDRSRDARPPPFRRSSTWAVPKRDIHRLSPALRHHGARPSGAAEPPGPRPMVTARVSRREPVAQAFTPRNWSGLPRSSVREDQLPPVPAFAQVADDRRTIGPPVLPWLGSSTSDVEPGSMQCD